MKISNAARLIFWLAAIFAIGILVRAESSEKRANIANTKSAPLRIVDQNGRPAVSGVPSATSQIVDVMVGPGFSFAPDTVNISVGDTVRWTGPVAATALAVVLSASRIRNFVRLTTWLVSQGLFPTPALFISTRLIRLVVIRTSALHTVFLAWPAWSM